MRVSQGILGNKRTKENYRREKENTNLFLGTSEQLNVDVHGEGRW